MQNKHEKTVNVPRMQLRAIVQPATFNQENRTVDVVWSTGARAVQFDWDTGYFMEELSMEASSVRLDRLNNGAPVLNTHQRSELEDVIGVVERAWIEGGVGYATIRFSNRADVQDILNDIRDGILRNISIGYNVMRYVDVTPDTNQRMKTLRAMDWEPFEISMVPVGADAQAGVRSEDGDAGTPCIIETGDAVEGTENNKEEVNMTTDVNKAAQPGADAQAQTAAVDTNAIADAATRAERSRTQDITALYRKHGIDEAVGLKLIADGQTIEQARAAILDEVGKRAEAGKTISHIAVGDDARSKARAAMENALMNRVTNGRTKLEEGNEYRGLSMLEMARECLESNGVKTRGLSKMDIVTRALHGTSDFPSILANVANKRLRDAYLESPQTFEPLVRRTSTPDFKQVMVAQLGEAPLLEKVGENGEFRRGTVGEAKEVYTLATYGKVVGITRQAIINDDLNAFNRLIPALGKQARNLESDLVWAQITNNGNMGDGNALFSVAHANTIGGVLNPADLTNLGTGRAKMRVQKGLDGKTVLNLAPKFLIVPAALETKADQVIAPITPNQAGSVNPFAGLQKIVEPRLDATSTAEFYLAAGVDQVDTIELCTLEGSEEPFIETRWGFDVDGMEIKCRHDVVAKAIDWRGLVKSSGA